MATVAGHIWCLGGEREPWAQCEKGGEAQAQRGDATSHVLQYRRQFSCLVFFPPPSPQSLSTPFPEHQMTHPRIIADGENISLTLLPMKNKAMDGATKQEATAEKRAPESKMNERRERKVRIWGWKDGRRSDQQGYGQKEPQHTMQW